jgi:hypothetical protein
VNAGRLKRMGLEARRNGQAPSRDQLTCEPDCRPLNQRRLQKNPPRLPLGSLFLHLGELRNSIPMQFRVRL